MKTSGSRGKFAAGALIALAAVGGVAMGAFVMGQIYVARTGGLERGERLSGIAAQSRLLADAIEGAPAGTFPALKQWGMRNSGSSLYRGALLDGQGRAIEQAGAQPPRALEDSNFRGRLGELLSGRQWTLKGGLLSSPDIVFVAQRLQDGRILVLERTEAGASAYWSVFSFLAVAAVALFWGLVMTGWSLWRARARARARDEFAAALDTVQDQALRRVELQALEAQRLLQEPPPQPKESPRPAELS